MTHRDLIADNRAGLAPTDCAGTMAAEGAYADRQLRGTTYTEKYIRLWRCTGCGCVIATKGGFAIDSHHPSVVALAAAFAAGGVLPPERSDAL